MKDKLPTREEIDDIRERIRAYDPAAKVTVVPMLKIYTELEEDKDRWDFYNFELEILKAHPELLMDFRVTSRDRK